MTNEELNRLIGERNALEVIANSYRHAIREARRLISLDEVGLADVVLAKAERIALLSEDADAAVRGIGARGVRWGDS